MRRRSPPGAALYLELRRNHSVGIGGFRYGLHAGCTVLTCSCTNPDIYWTSTSFDSDPALAWVVDFDFALGGVLDKGTGQ